ncbi:MAG: DNA-directed RNA polymerase subunit omega [Prevotellaceae bacterium]|jgi:DNA-directed RNA polymerase subunit K/omega|nr:DNA-directed RNA polymerase subunit omega [Prevotellaceae bacterium]
METKKTTVPTNTTTRDIGQLSSKVGNVYETTMIIAKRANQIAAETKQELNRKLEEFSDFSDNLEETFENREQIEISRYYERQPKPTLVAVQELLNDKIYYRKVDEHPENKTA